MNKRVKTVAFVLVILLSTSLFAFTEGTGNEEHHFDWMGFIGKVVNSVILFGGLFLLLRKPIGKVLKQKSGEIKADIGHREEQLNMASDQLDDIKNRLSKIEEEIIDMKSAAEKNGNEEQKRLEELGAKEAQRILDITDAEIATKIENSIRNLKARIADLTIEHFKNDIRIRLDEQAHEKIIEKNIEICGDIIERK
jgi:F-type H+-transporting ATPase subunit b